MRLSGEILVNDDTQALCVFNSFTSIEPTTIDWKTTGFAEGQIESKKGAKCSAIGERCTTYRGSLAYLIAGHSYQCQMLYLLKLLGLQKTTVIHS